MITSQVDIDLYSEPGSWRSIFARATLLALTGERILVMDLVLDDNPNSSEDLFDINGFTILCYVQPNPSQAEITDFVNSIITHTGGHYDRIMIYAHKKWSAELIALFNM